MAEAHFAFCFRFMRENCGKGKKMRKNRGKLEKIAEIAENLRILWKNHGKISMSQWRISKCLKVFSRFCKIWFSKVGPRGCGHGMGFEVKSRKTSFFKYGFHRFPEKKSFLHLACFWQYWNTFMLENMEVRGSPLEGWGEPRVRPAGLTGNFFRGFG